jgi:hypothetical protein
MKRNNPGLQLLSKKGKIKSERFWENEIAGNRHRRRRPDLEINPDADGESRC